jgi:WD40 repeat protein
MLMGDGPKSKKKRGAKKGESEDEDELEQKKLSNPEVVDMHLVWEDKMIMMLCCNAKEYIVYDEQDPDSSTILRRVQGAHKEEITIMAYDYHLSLVATGCINGEIAIYDFEMSKIEGLLIGHTGDITALEFFSPYPLLISASMDSHVCIWGVRPIAQKYLNVCIKRYANYSWNMEKDVPCIVSRLLIWENEDALGIKKYRRLKGQQLPAIRYRNFEHNFALSFREDLDEFYDEEFPQKSHQYVNHPEDYKVSKLAETEAYQILLNDEKSKTFVTQAQSVGTDYNEKVKERTHRAYMYVGDELGYLKVWDLASFLRNSDIQKVKSHVEHKTSFNPRRQEIVNCAAYTLQNRKFYKLKPHKLPQPVDPAMTGVLIREVLGHTSVITSITKIELSDIQLLLTAGKDNKVRTWALDLDLHGNINGKTDKDDLRWSFPTN